MIIVEIKVIPRGDHSKTKNLCQIEIVNDLSGDEEIGNYDFVISSPNLDRYEDRVEKHERRDGVLVLLRKVLEKSTR